MNGLGTLLIIGVVMYFLFSRNRGMGGMGCCGGHSYYGPTHGKPQHPNTQDSPDNRESEKIIDLKPDEYKVLSENPK